MKGFAMLGIGKAGWIEKDRPVCGPLDAIVKPLALSPCTSDIHTVWEGALGERHNMILGHEGCGVVVEVGSLVKDFKVGDRVMVAAITPDWSSLEAQGGYITHNLVLFKKCHRPHKHWPEKPVCGAKPISVTSIDYYRSLCPKNPINTACGSKQTVLFV